MKTIKIGQVENEIVNTMKKYTKEVEVGLEKAIEEEAGESARELRRTTYRRSGKTANSWCAQKISKGYVVRSTKPHYRKQHLLNNDHVIIAHGKKVGYWKGKHFIEPVESNVPDRIAKRFKEILR